MKGGSEVTSSLQGGGGHRNLISHIPIFLALISHIPIFHPNLPHSTLHAARNDLKSHDFRTNIYKYIYINI